MGIDKELLAKNAQTIVASPRGILAADQTPEAMSSDLTSRGGKAGYEERLAFRNATLPAKMGKYVGGVILHDEMVRSGVNWAEILEQQGILAGGTVDQDFGKVEETGELLTNGSVGLEKRCEEYAALGMKFAKWRSILNADVSDIALEKNLELSASYAAAAQVAGLVPICEPDLQFAGEHDEKSFQEISIKAWDLLFRKLKEKDVYLPGVILKPSWIIPGVSAKTTPSSKELAELTVSSLIKHVPSEIAGIAFLSGGIPFDRSLELLREISIAGKAQNAPWRLTFSFGRALLDEPADEFVKTGRSDDSAVLDKMIDAVRRASEASTAT